MRIYVAGHSGLVGSALVRAIENNPNHSWLGKRRSELDLRDRMSAHSYLMAEKPDAVVIAAARVGGILANKTQPVEFLSDNVQIAINLLDACHAAQVPKVLFLASSCAYPRNAQQPIREESLLSGALEETNEAYAIAKIAGIKLVDAYRRQYSKNWFSVMPTNVFGVNDNFDSNSSHVIPGLIAKFHAAKLANESFVQLWGDGSPNREFIHADDLGDALLHLLEAETNRDLVNIGTGEEISIADLADLISSIVGYQGEIRWSGGELNGTPRKKLDNTRISSTGWIPKVSLSSGIQSTYDWYRANHHS